MREGSCDILIVGGGVGGCAATMAACSLGRRVVMTEPTDWIGGQLTSQAVPPDEHQWIEQLGCTARYREYRDRVRRYYKDHRPLTAAAKADPFLNPGGGWVSFLCHEPTVGLDILKQMLQPHIAAGLLEVHLETEPSSAHVDADHVREVVLRAANGEEKTISAKYVLDATETGDLSPLTGTEYVLGAESRRDTGEAHAVPGAPEPHNQQAITWVYALGWNPGGDNAIPKPAAYERWRAYQPDFWPGPLLGWDVIKAHSGEPGHLPLFNIADPEYELFSYRQVVEPCLYETNPPGPATLVNWPQNDYFLRPIIDVSQEDQARALDEARQLGLCLLHWMQTEAPRHDRGFGYPELCLRPDVVGTADGFAKAPYIRESRRIRARFTVCEQHVSSEANQGRDRAKDFPDTVGLGSYRIDLHPSTSGVGIIDFDALPFQIPLGALIPVRMRNLLPCCKNIGTTHITNGCYRLHPIEWNIGEAAGLLAAFCLQRAVEPHHVYESPGLLSDFQALLQDQGIELKWPEPLPAPINAKTRK